MLEEIMLEEGAREITPENTKTFEMKAVAANLDQSGFDYSELVKNMEQTGSLFVPVLTEDGRQIGSATVYLEAVKEVFYDFNGRDGDEVERNCLTCSIYIDYATEERLLIETDSIKYWPRLVGNFLYRPFGEYLVDRQPVRVWGIQLKAVVMSTTRNPDGRIHWATRAQ